MANSTFCVFRDLNIPPDSQITRARIAFQSFSTEGGVDLNADIYFTDEDDAQAPTDKTDLDGRSLTSLVPWTNIENWFDNRIYSTPELKTILQSVIDRANWAEDNNVMVVIKTDTTPGLYRAWSAYEYLGGVEKATLRVWWKEPIQIQTPYISPAGEFQIFNFNCSISTYPTDASIYYTKDGSEPDETDILYTGPFLITLNTTIKARAYKQYWTPSEIATQVYTFLFESIGDHIPILPLGRSGGLGHSQTYQDDIIYVLARTWGDDPTGPTLITYNTLTEAKGEDLIESGNYVYATCMGIHVDSSGYVHVLYNDRTGSSSPYAWPVKYATNKTGSWVITVIYSDAVYEPSHGFITVDSSGYAHAFYCVKDVSGTNRSIAHSTNQSGSWQTELIATNTEGSRVSGVMYSNDTFAIFYTGVDQTYPIPDYLVVSEGSWGSWTHSSLTDGDGEVWGISSCVDSGNNSYHFYIGWVNGHLWKVSKVAGSWVSSDQGSTGVPYAKGLRGVTVDSSGKFHISFMDDLYPWYGTNDGGSWEFSSTRNKDRDAFDRHQQPAWEGIDYDESKNTIYMVYRIPPDQPPETYWLMAHDKNL